MTRRLRHSGRPGGARVLPVLVLAVLAGVLAMHGLGPGVAGPAAGTHQATASAPVHRAHAAVGHGDPVAEPCGHGTLTDDHGGGGSGHLEHADDTCAAAGVGGAPTLPALVRSAAVPLHVVLPPSGPPADARSSRDPPSLSTLQLLRI